MRATDSEEGLSSSVHCQLDNTQIEQLRKYGTEESVLAGEVQMYQTRRKEKTLLGTGHPGQFAMLDLIYERPAAAKVVMSKPGRVLRLTPERLRTIGGENSELSVFLRSFLARESNMSSREE